MPEGAIDTSDIPELTAEDFARALRFHEVYRPRKQQITSRIDADVLLWLKSKGQGYQSRLNAIFRKAMIRGFASLPAAIVRFLPWHRFSHDIERHRIKRHGMRLRAKRTTERRGKESWTFWPKSKTAAPCARSRPIR
jgi:uncharacterized protein (DUF4415 family)